MLKNSENYHNQEHFSGSDAEIPKTKKFVFQIEPENINFVEGLSYQEKNDLVNYLLANYKLSSYYNRKKGENIKFAKKAAWIFLAVAVGIPLIIYISSISLKMTKHSYVDMQKNFEKLF